MKFPPIPGTSPLPYSPAPPIADNEPLPLALTSPKPPTANSKQIFAFWHLGLGSLPPYLLRNVIAWYRRYSPLGWTIYVFDNVPGSPLNVARYIDTSSPSVVPAAFTNGAITGKYTAQHTSDLIRYPLILKYGGIYLDVGILQFGDLDWLWTKRISNPDSPYDFAGFTMGEDPDLSIVNFAFGSKPDNPLVHRAHNILLKVWEGRTNTTGMHSHPLLSNTPLLRVPSEVEVDDEEQGKIIINAEYMTDYAIQIQCMGAAQRWLDEDDCWNGPEYVREKCWLLSMFDYAYVNEQMTGWNGQRQLDLFAQRMPKPGEEETQDQALARQIVERVVTESWCIKLMHGFSAKLFGSDTLGMLWRKHHGSDCGEGTYAAWLRWAQVHCIQETPIEPMKVPVYEPTMRGRLIQ
ncbi:hypothetical protein CC78DRAFT_579672 [Lojkania enalia]|uniref:Capsule polysaccharide biosynthesis protein n=1 Tax=Lojkania enalia TaxID=147567 RepID=A0A9P4N6W1_9PLEO|nr:hypothetical protein CC78DRAFT_579672 [Didymosphaeria enalia]